MVVFVQSPGTKRITTKNIRPGSLGSIAEKIA